MEQDSYDDIQHNLSGGSALEEDQSYNSDQEIYPPQLQELLSSIPIFNEPHPEPSQEEKPKMPETPLEPFQLTEDNGVCKLCYKYAINAVLCNNQKCSVLMCGNCVTQTTKKNEKKCPFCRVEPFSPLPSPYQKQINQLEWKCTLCHQMYILEEESKHYKKICSYFHKISCLYCPEKLHQAEVINHTRVFHEDKIDEIISYIYQRPPGIYDPKELTSKNSQYLGRIGKSPHLGTTGKFYCGERLEPPKCSCCNGFCGPTNGQNCSECMRLDLMRLGVQKGCLVNSSGHVCWRKGNTFVCNGMNYYENTFCNEGSPCRSCYNMTKNIQRYAHLL